MQRRYRLTHNKSFNYIYRNGKSVGGKHLVLLYSPSKGSLRIGFSVSKKIGKAVVRNKTKRRLKEGLRQFIPHMNKGYNYIFLARTGAGELTYHELFAEATSLLRKAKLTIGE